MNGYFILFLSTPGIDVNVKDEVSCCSCKVFAQISTHIKEQNNSTDANYVDLHADVSKTQFSRKPSTIFRTF